MKSSLKRLVVVVASMILVFVAIQMISSIALLASAADRVYFGSGQFVFLSLLLIFLFFALSTVVMYFRLPQALIPPEETTGPKHEQYIARLKESLRGNPRLSGRQIETDEDLSTALAILSREVDMVIRQTAGTVFAGTAVMQNGRIDGFITLYTQARMVWQIASIYYQRPSPRQMLYLYSSVGGAALLAQSIEEVDFSEIIAPMVVSAIPSMKGAIPGFQGITNLLVDSLAGGAANASVTIRVGIVAKQYCEARSALSRQAVRKNATIASLAMVGDVIKENSATIVTRVWDGVGSLVSDTVDSAVKKLRDTADQVAEATSEASRKMVESMNASAQGMQQVASNASMRIKDSTADATRTFVEVVDSKTEGIKVTIDRATEKIRISSSEAGAMISGAMDTTMGGVKSGIGGASNSIKNGVSSVVNAYGSVVIATKEAVEGASTGTAKRAVLNASESVAGKVIAGASHVKEAFSATADGAKSIASKVGIAKAQDERGSEST